MAGLTREQRAAKVAAANVGIEDQPEALRVSVLERRLQNPFGMPAAPVRLRDKTMFPRWFNNSLQHDRFYIAGENGWKGVKPEDVIDLKQIGSYSQSPEGWVCRGERGQEVLMCIERDFWNRLQLAKTRKNLELMRDTTGEQNRALEAASKKLGPQVAEQMEAVKRVMNVTDNYERIEKLPETAE
jgi:hypothetical protein